VSIILFLNKLARHWILPLVNNHMNNCTLGGVEYLQMNWEQGSAGCPLAFSSL
jgi:hypothetical protein